MGLELTPIKKIKVSVAADGFKIPLMKYFLNQSAYHLKEIVTTPLLFKRLLCNDGQKERCHLEVLGGLQKAQPNHNQR